jgi:hypothetical protein
VRVRRDPCASALIPQHPFPTTLSAASCPSTSFGVRARPAETARIFARYDCPCLGAIYGSSSIPFRPSRWVTPRVLFLERRPLLRLPAQMKAPPLRAHYFLKLLLSAEVGVAARPSARSPHRPVPEESQYPASPTTAAPLRGPETQGQTRTDMVRHRSACSPDILEKALPSRRGLGLRARGNKDRWAKGMKFPTRQKRGEAPTTPAHCGRAL